MPLAATSWPSGVVGMTPRDEAAVDGETMERAPRANMEVVRPSPTMRHVDGLRRWLGNAILVMVD